MRSYRADPTHYTFWQLTGAEYRQLADEFAEHTMADPGFAGALVVGVLTNRLLDVSENAWARARLLELRGCA